MSSLQMASVARWMFLNPPKTCIVWSASTILVLVAFSMANFVLPEIQVLATQADKYLATFLPPFPAIRPIARLLCSPFRVLTSLISKLNTYQFLRQL